MSLHITNPLIMSFNVQDGCHDGEVRGGFNSHLAFLPPFLCIQNELQKG